MYAMNWAGYSLFDRNFRVELIDHFLSLVKEISSEEEFIPWIEQETAVRGR